jgi:prepilin signal peptidase PulO-like enzyme (type II secretory pathway)
MCITSLYLGLIIGSFLGVVIMCLLKSGDDKYD